MRYGKANDAFNYDTFLVSSLMRLYGWVIIFRANGLLDKFLMSIGLINDPLKLLYTYPAVAVGMIYLCYRL